jgi:hypothetical protein
LTASEVQRFVVDAKAGGPFEHDVLAVREGGLGLEELVGRARAAGYDITAEEVKAYVLGQMATTTTTSRVRVGEGGDVAVVTSTMEIQVVALIVPFVSGSGIGRSLPAEERILPAEEE